MGTMKYFGNMRIARKLMLVSMTVFLIPLVICYVLNIKIVMDELDAHAMDFAESFNSQIVAGLDHFIQDYEAMSVSVLVDNQLFSYSGKEDRTMTELVGDHESMRKVLFRLTQLQPELTSASILMKTGDFVQTGVAGIKIDEPVIREVEWVRQIEEYDESFYLVPAHKTGYWNRRTDEITITFVRKIKSSGVRYLGALLIDVNPTAAINLNERFESAKDRYGMEICIYDSLGRVIYDTRPFAQGDLQPDGFYQMQEFGSDYTVLTGTSEKLGIHVVTAIPKASELLGQNRVAMLMVILALICCTIIFLLVISVSHRITRPLARLGYGMSRMKDGEYITINDYPYSDELGDLISSYNHMICEMQQLIDRVYISEIKRKDSEIFALQSQINPHMLFNTLECIRLKALLDGNTEVSQMIAMLARMFRTILDSMSTRHVIKDELNYAQQYMQLQNLREDGRFTFSCDVEEELLDLPCIPIFFQPLIENSIEHGQCNREGKLNIRIIGRSRGDRAVFTIMDDGQGMRPESRQKIQEHLEAIRENPDMLLAARKNNSRNIGMANILMRLMVNDDKNSDLRIVYSNEQGTCVEVTMSKSSTEQNR